MRPQLSPVLRCLASGLFFLVYTGIMAMTNGVTSASAAPVPKCTAHSDISARFVSPNGAGGMFYFLIAFPNSGATSCSVSGVPRAQPVQGLSKTPVGPAAIYQPIAGVSRGTVVLHAHGGRIYVEYYIMNEANISKSRCKPATANGVELQPFGTRNFYIPINRPGATEVCTKLASTSVGALSSRTY